MGGDIAAVKEQIIQLVTSTIGSNNEPADYVLSLFNDPASLNEGFVYTSGQDMIDKIATIVVSGGDDCPEFAAAGILKAIELSKQRSTVLVFTDADAKDSDRLQEVTDAALAKNIPITSVLSSQCASRKRRDTLVRKRRETQLFYQSLSQSTGGTVYNTDKENFGSVLTEVVKIVFPTSEVLIETYEWKDNEVGHKHINVDGSIQLLKISIKGGSDERDIDFHYTNGTALSLPSTGASRVIASNNEVIISIQNLTHGAYFLHKNINHAYVINITAQSSIKVVDGMYEKSTSGSLVTLHGSPVSGNNYTYFVVVFNMVNGTCNNLYMVNSSGYIMSSYKPDSRSSEYDMLCSTDIVIPDYAFQMKLNVSNVLGDPVVRTARSVYRPTSVELNVIASSDDVPIGNERVVTYEVTNTGANIDNYIVQISDDHSYVLAPDSMNHTLGSGEKTDGNFTLLPNSTTGMFKYTVAVFVNSSAEVKQTISRTLIVTDIQRPNCNVLMKSGECNVSSLNTANCSKYTWSAKAEVTFKETQLESLSSTIGNTSMLQYTNISGRMEGPVAVNISGDCCNPSLSISAVDVDGYISQCHFELSNGLPVQSVEPIIEQVIHPILNTNIFSKTFAVIVAVSVCFVVLCIVIFAGVITYKYFGQTKTMKANHVNSTTRAQNRTRQKVENKPKINGQNRPYSFENRLVRCKDRHNDSYIEWY
ncbi:hemicentin-1-like [Mytilus edulis]|uniref:hemicentin-1-like n=1 Tax=Mytilus edulis TaxID=6550 RepID=UPI0039F0EA00